jgi:hypothetical protein
VIPKVDAAGTCLVCNAPEIAEHDVEAHLVHPRETADELDARRAPTGLENAGADWPTDPYAAGEYSESLGADGAPRQDMLSMFVEAETPEEESSQIVRLVFGEFGEPRAAAPESTLRPPPATPIAPTRRNVPERRPGAGAHVAAQRIVTMTLAAARAHLRRHPDDLEALLALPTRGDIEIKAAGVIVEEAERAERGAA